jgi:succinate dehydrogenase/fumarate reductase flavoprotein subunit
MAALLRHWPETVTRAGGRVQPGSACEGLLRDSDGAVRGVRLPGGEELEAGAVLLATGGFQGNPELVAERLGPGAAEMLPRFHAGSTGDGLRMARAAGAAEAPGPGDGFYGHLVPRPLGRFDTDDFLPLTQYHSSHGVLVNADGQRFTEEWRGDEVSNQATLHQPGARALLLFDERVRADNAVGAPYPHGQVVDRLALAAAAGARVLRAPTLKRLLAAVSDWGYDAAMLAETLHDRGAALRAPPFNAVEVQPTLTFTFGGLRADRDGRVLDGHGRPVPRLFAAGADVGGLQGPGYVGGLVLGMVFGPRAADAALEMTLTSA